MEPEAFTLNFVDQTITVTFTDGSEKIYYDAETYLADYPDRRKDAIAIGWIPEEA